MKGLTRDKLQLCSIQGRLFELAARNGADPVAFIDEFMASKVAARLDDTYDRLQWAGEEYICEELDDELGGFEPASCSQPEDVLFWVGYTYRFWHYLTGESSAEISRAADARMMIACWPGYHALDVEAAIERLREAAEMRAAAGFLEE